VVLDPAPPRRAGPEPAARLARRAVAARDDLPAILADERGAVRVEDLEALTGSRSARPDVGGWVLRDGVLDAAVAGVERYLADVHRARPREAGATLAGARGALAASIRGLTGRPDPDLVDALLDRLEREGRVARSGGAVRLPSHTGEVHPDDPLVRRLLAEVDAPNPAQPPTIPDLIARGVPRDVIEAAARSGLVVRVSPALVFAPSLVERAERIVTGSGGGGITVSAFREALGTSRKYALPLLEWFDQRGLTRREGDLRFARS
jgi:selenocysteine-specific elongation factor